MSDYKISIVTICWNNLSEIEETILSVVNQSYKNIEYIVVDGGSTDGTVDIIKKYAKGGPEYSKHPNCITNWVSEPDGGIYDAMNKGITMATGSYINFMNAGDKFHSCDVISNVVSGIKGSPSIIYGDENIIYDNRVVLWTARPLETTKQRMPFGHQSCFFKTDYHKQNLYDISFKIRADYKLVYQAYLKGLEFQYLPIVIADYNAKNGGISVINHRLRYQESYRIWGIEHKPIKKFLYNLKLKCVLLKGKLPRKIQNIINLYTKRKEVRVDIKS